MRALFLCFIFLTSIFGREITDMAGRKVVVPDKITKVFGSAPPSTYAAYILDPSLIVGLNFSPAKGFNEASGMLDKKFASLPVVGGLQGGIQGINREALLALKPEIILSWASKDSFKNNNAEKMTEKMMGESKIPTVYVELDDIDDMPTAIAFLGNLLNKQDRAKELAEYAKALTSKTKETLAKHPKNSLPVVYYAEGVDGLATECEDSSHYETIKYAGGANPHKCKSKGGIGLEKVSIEQVVGYNPDIIIAQEKTFFDAVRSDPKWKNIKAVKNNEIYLVPKAPFNWVDRPPSFMRFLGVRWAQRHILKTSSDVELKNEIKKFYKLFLSVELSDAQISKMSAGK